MDHTSVNQIIIDIMVFFAVLGGIDRVFGGRFGLWNEMEGGIRVMGDLFIAMTGFICLSPVLADLLAPMIVPVYEALGADPAMFAGTLFGIDMGGYPIAMSMAQSVESGQFAGTIVASMLGVTVVFTIPFALTAVDKQDWPCLATGVLCGVVTIPFGCLIGGLIAGFPVNMILKNLIPVVIVSVLIAAGMVLIPVKMISGFEVFGKCMIAVSTVGLVAILVETLTGIVVIPNMAPLSESVTAVGMIALTLAGAYPMIAIVTKILDRLLKHIGQKLGMNETASAGLIVTCANSIPTFGLIREMDPVGKTVNFAFMVSGAFALGDHLGFVAGVEKAMMLPVLGGKLAAAVAAAMLAWVLSRKRGLPE